MGVLIGWPVMMPYPKYINEAQDPPPNSWYMLKSLVVLLLYVDSGHGH